MTESFDFRLREPPGPIARWVQSIWYARGRAGYAEQILPLNQMVLLINLGDPHRIVSGTRTERMDTTWLVGQQTSLYSSEVLGETHAMGVVFEPDGAAPFLRMPAAEVTDAIVALDGFASDWGVRLREPLLELTDPDAQLDLLGRLLVDRFVMPSQSDKWRRTGHALRLMQSGAPLAAVSDRLGVSQKTMIDDFRMFVGVTPKMVGRIQRFNHALQRIAQLHEPDWAEIAASCGYYDHSHLIRDFHRFAGTTPGNYLAARRKLYDDLSANPNFVPIHDD